MLGFGPQSIRTSAFVRGGLIPPLLRGHMAEKIRPHRPWPSFFCGDPPRNPCMNPQSECPPTLLFTPDLPPPPVFLDGSGGPDQNTRSKFKLRRGRRRRGYSISDELLRGFNVLGLAEGIISLILHGPGKWRALARKRKKK